MTIRTTAARLRPSLESAIWVLVHTMMMSARPCQGCMSTVGTTGELSGRPPPNRVDRLRRAPAHAGVCRRDDMTRLRGTPPAGTTRARLAGRPAGRPGGAGYAEAGGALHGPRVASHRRRRPLASTAPRWAHSSGRHTPRQRLKPGDPSNAEITKKVARNFCAQLTLSISLITAGLRLPLI